MTPEQYYSLGYTPLPIMQGHKKPTVTGWPTVARDILLTCFNPGDGVGIRLGPIKALDVDIYDNGLTTELLGFADLLLGEQAYRVGEAPKFLIVFNCPEIEHKITSKKFKNPADGTINAIEVLASSGQQFIADHIHPDTEMPYTWHRGELPHIDDVVRVDPWMIEAIITFFEKRATELGWIEINTTKPSTEQTSEQRTYNKSYNIVDLLTQYGWVATGEDQWVRPGKKIGVGGTVTGNTFYCFSSSTVLEERCIIRPYDLVLAYAFNGDVVAMSDHVSDTVINSLRSAGFGVGVEVPVGASVTSPVDNLLSQLSYSQINHPDVWFPLVVSTRLSPVDLDVVLTRLGEHPMVEGSKRVLKAEYEQRLTEYNNNQIESEAIQEGKHVVHWSVRQVGVCMTATETALMSVNGSLEYFSYAGRLSYTIESEPKTNKRNGTPPKHHLIRQYSRNTLTQRSEESADFLSYKGQEVVKIGVPKDLIGHMLENPLSLAPVVHGLVRHPVLTYDNRLICEEGIDKETGLMLKFGGHKFDDIGTCDQVGAGVLVKKVNSLLFSEYTFQSNGTGHVAAVGGLMSVLQRKVIDDCPGFMITANQGSTGKSTMVDMFCVTATGRLAAPLSFSSSRSEMEKAVLASLMESPNMLFFDNLTDGKEVVSDIISVLITQQSFKGRILGLSEMVEVPTNMVVLLTGNNISTSTDLAPRIVKIGLTSSEEDPTHKQYDDDMIVRKCLSVRNEVITALLTIVRGYIDAGRPRVITHASRFTDWDAMVRSPLMWATGVDIEDNISINREDSGEFQATENLMFSLRCIFGNDDFTAKNIQNVCETKLFTSRDPSMSVIDIVDGIEEHLDTLNYGKEIKGAKTIAWILKKMIGKNIKGYKIVKKKLRLNLGYAIVKVDLHK